MLEMPIVPELSKTPFLNFVLKSLKVQIRSSLDQGTPCFKVLLELLIEKNVVQWASDVKEIGDVLSIYKGYRSGNC